MTRAQEHMRDVAALGCIVCRKFLGAHSPADAHHLIRGGRKIDDFHVIPLCFLHHRAGVKNEDCVSRHPWKKEFELRYGSEWSLFRETNHLLARSA